MDFNNHDDLAKIRKAIEDTVDDLKKTLITKNVEYGQSAFRIPPFTPNMSNESAILVRMGDKVERLQSLAKRCVNLDRVEYESFDDTVLDLGGYCVLYMALKKLRKLYEEENKNNND